MITKHGQVQAGHTPCFETDKKSNVVRDGKAVRLKDKQKAASAGRERLKTMGLV